MIVQDVLHRLYRSILEPPHLQPPVGRLAAGINDTQDTLIVQGFAVPEDEDLMRNGVIIEIGTELFEVNSYDEFSGECGVERASLGTVAAEHEINARVKLSPPFAKQSAVEAIGDNILQLFPSLYTVRLAPIVPVQGGVCPIDDNLAVEVIGIYEDPNDSTPFTTGVVVEAHPAVPGRCIVVDHWWGGSLWARYRRRMGSVASVDDDLADLGVDPRWVQIVTVGAAADLMVGQDIPESQVEWVGSILKTEGIRVGQRLSLSAGLAQYRDILLKRAQDEMNAEYRATIRHKPLLVRRSALG